MTFHRVYPVNPVRKDFRIAAKEPVGGLRTSAENAKVDFFFAIFAFFRGNKTHLENHRRTRSWTLPGRTLRVRPDLFESGLFKARSPERHL